ncbi:MAG: 6-phosphogluconolactonase [Patescibacteria group bacterium]|nr:6-phosphogluconolactonase [Patescibacteria group bacterium]
MTLQWVRVADYDAMCREAAARMTAVIDGAAAEDRPILLGLATGNTMIGVYKQLAARLNASGGNLSQLHTFNLDEYVQDDGRCVPPQHPLSYRAYMQRYLFSLLDGKLGMNAAHVHFPDPEDPEAYDGLIDRMGGLDLQLLGLGFNGHIAFNEPMPETEISAEAFAALPSRVIDLTERTIEANARLTAGGDRNQVPRRAVTMGMKPLLAARELLLLTCFPEQREPLERIRRGTITPSLPGSYLLGHANATIVYAQDSVGLEEG